MSASDTRAKQDNRRQTMMAIVLGTVLMALVPAPALARPAPDTTLQAVDNLSRYCTACWRNARLHPDCWCDCTQEVFSRLLARVAPNDWDRLLQKDSEERRELLRAIDAVKKLTQRRKKWLPPTYDHPADHNDLHRRQVADQREAVAEAAEQVLSPRQRRIVQLSFDGWSVQEIAADMHTPPARVSDEKYKAIRKLRRSLSGDW
jgi:RNA polymerase sigma factor (sigma-70 family)